MPERGNIPAPMTNMQNLNSRYWRRIEQEERPLHRAEGIVRRTNLQVFCKPFLKV
jgi:hypothetical protein